MNCEDEQIHIPSAIQPHGAFVAVRADSGIVTHVSANLASLIGVAAGEALGRPLGEIFGEAPCRTLLGDGEREAALYRTCTLTDASGGIIHLRSFRSNVFVCVDIERVQTASLQALPINLTLSVIETFRQAKSQQELCELAVSGLREITGFDRVMAYRFAEDGHGEVIAEALRPPLQPYLGLRYPASDIPPQARRLYRIQRTGAIADCNYEPVPLIAGPASADEPALDLTRSALRSVSPLHREYMRNMNTMASLTVGIRQGDHLWGMLVCHHATPRIANPASRTDAAMVGEVMALLLGSLYQSEVDAQRSAGNASLRALKHRLTTQDVLIEALAAGGDELLQLVGAEGALLQCSGQTRLLGTTPPMQAALQALAAIRRGAADEVIAVNDLGLRYPELCDCVEYGSGALLVALGGQKNGDAILWFRPEQSRTVTWGGDPAVHATVDPTTQRLSPRQSFAAWKQIVRGYAAPWSGGAVLTARDLGRTVEREMARRATAELARAEKHAQLGQLTTNMAHELNQPLASISLAAENALRKLTKLPEALPLVQQKLNLIVEMASDAADIIDRMRVLGRTDSGAAGPVAVADVLSRVESRMRSRLRSDGVSLQQNFRQGLPPAFAKGLALEQVFLNLIVNACDAYTAAAPTIPAALRIINLTATTESGRMRIGVQDDAGGIAPDVLPRIFEPFFSTKPIGQGTGLGLSLSYGNIVDMGGALSVQSVGGRTTFTVELPLVPSDK